MKRIVSTLLILLLGAAVLAGCSNTSTSSTEVVATANSAASANEEDKISIVSSIFPGYDFARAVAGDNAEITMLLPPGSESHSYDPTPKDIIEIQNCDIFIYVGGESDEWVARILSSIDTSNMQVIAMMDLVETVEEEIVEGMQEDAHDHSHSSGVFEDDEVENRTLSDWAGDWQSVYPYLLDGTLAPVMEHKAEESEDKTAQDYYDYYEVGYATDVERIVITDNSLTFYQNGEASTATYEYKGYEILTYESGNKGVRYQFEATGETNGAPRYIQFSDHEIGPTEAEHFHLYWGDDSFEALLSELENWPTYYPSALDADGILDEMLGHDHSEEEVELDEHVWTSPINAITIVEGIRNAISTIDATNTDTYNTNAAAYITQLEELDAAFREVVANATYHTLIFGDRFPFRYFVDEYGLDYYAAFPGCSSETEPSAQTVAFLINKVNDEGIPAVFHIELSNEKVADTICESTGAQKLQLHSCHNVTRDQMNEGVTYIDLMQQNVEALRQALS